MDGVTSDIGYELEICKPSLGQPYPMDDCQGIRVEPAGGGAVRVEVQQFVRAYPPEPHTNWTSTDHLQRMVIPDWHLDTFIGAIRRCAGKG